MTKQAFAFVRAPGLIDIGEHIDNFLFIHLYSFEYSCLPMHFSLLFAMDDVRLWIDRVKNMKIEWNRAKSMAFNEPIAKTNIPTPKRLIKHKWDIYDDMQ